MSEDMEAVVEPGQVDEKPGQKLIAALVKAQAQMKFATKDVRNEFFKSKYADLASVADAVHGPFAANGLAFTHDVEDVEDGVRVRCILLHESGEWWPRKWVRVLTKDRTAQAQGSASTYGRRYTLQAAAGVVSDDDDGNEASGKNATPSRGLSSIPKKAEPEAQQKLADAQLQAWSDEQLREKIMEAEGVIAKTKKADPRLPAMLAKLQTIRDELATRECGESVSP